MVLQTDSLTFAQTQLVRRENRLEGLEHGPAAAQGMYVVAKTRNVTNSIQYSDMVKFHGQITSCHLQA